MSLLLKALKQAETANTARPGERPDASADAGDIGLEPMTAHEPAKASDWVEPPGLLFGEAASGSLRARPSLRLPHLSLVPFTALVAAVIAIGYGIYLYFALQPPTPLPPTGPVSSPAPMPATPAPLSAPAETVAGEIAPPLQAAPLPPPPLGAPPAPEAEPTPAPATTPARAAAPAAQAAAQPAATRAVSATPRTEAPAAPPRFQPDPQAALLAQAYAAYERGALTEAQRLYTQAAARNRSVDALLGLAAIASVQNREADAQRFYREALEIDPRNATAQGALLDLVGSTDALAAESRLKTLIDRDPSAHLYQTLGNLYADQKRWNDAQAAYFEAYRHAPDNGDYAFNLAVSLDHLREYAAARSYYEKALASAGAHRFDRAQAEARLQQLKAAR